MSAKLIIAEFDREQSMPWSALCVEAMEHMRLSYSRTGSAELPSALGDAAVLVLPTVSPINVQDRTIVDTWVRAGGTLITCGGVGDLAVTAGVHDEEVVDEGYVSVESTWGWSPRFDVDLHAFGGHRLTISNEDVFVLARWQDGSAAVTRRCLDAGQIIVIGADIWQSIGRIQQGWPVDRPGTPAADGSAAVGADGILRVDDGLALSFQRDRALPGGGAGSGDHESVYPPQNPVPIFHRPQADLWRELIQHVIFDATQRQDIALGWLHYWPGGVSAIGHISHDSDRNIDVEAAAGLEAFAAAGVQVTWCHCWPGGYTESTVAAISDAGHEQALHFNALGDDDGMPWGADGLQQQHQWARELTGEPIISNKNHYTRWEGWTEFYEWCEQVGIQIDESRGPSKPGTVGFPYGTSHVGFPVSATGDPYDVLALPLHCQDVGWTSHEAVVPTILDQALTHNGVAHVLFHCVHLSRWPRVVDALKEVVRAGRQRGMRWWTAAQINSFERARRALTVDVQAAGEDAWNVRVTASAPFERAGILVSVPDTARRWTASALVGGVEVPVTAVTRHGRAFLELIADIPAGTTDFRLAATEQS